jgi:DNA modification methylase
LQLIEVRVVMDKFSVEERFDIGPLVTFIPNKRHPIYNWFHFKEGFSRDFVLLMLDLFKVVKGGWVLDPFCGSGTTLLASKERSINSVGVDAMPLCVFLSQVKTMNYDIEKLKETSRNIFAQKFIAPDIRRLSPLVKHAFTKYAQEDILFFRSVVKQIEDPVIRNFFTLALIVASEKISFAYKDGAVIKIHRVKNTPPFKPMLKRTIKKMINDLKRFGSTSAQVKVFHGDARNLNFLEDSTFDAVITSPPYLNIIDYMKVYKIENELFFEDSKEESIHSYIGLRVEDKYNDLTNLSVPPVAKAYFKDMKVALQEQYRVLKDNGKVAMVVGEGVFPDQIVPVHTILAGFAQDVGFKVERIIYVNKRTVTDHNRNKIGIALESVLIFKK